MTIADRITRILVQDFRVPASKVSCSTCLYQDLEWDSLEHVEFIMALEEEFDLDAIPDAVSETILTVADAIKTVEARIAAEVV